MSLKCLLNCIPAFAAVGAEGQVRRWVHVGLRRQQLVRVLEHAAEHQSRPLDDLVGDARQQVGRGDVGCPAGASPGGRFNSSSYFLAKTD